MMMNMFSMFDSNINKIPMNIIINMLMLLTMMKINKMWMNKKFSYIMNKIIKNMMENKNNKPMMKMFVTTSIMIVLINMMNLMPNIMSMTSMMSINLSMTMTMWMTMMMMNMKNKKVMMMNMSPKNTPIAMMWIINMIEMNSMMFQIMSLTMRLSINMMLGHIIMMLMKKIVPMMMYMMIELLIIMIQSYIFMTLNLLNFNNVN